MGSSGGGSFMDSDAALGWGQMHDPGGFFGASDRKAGLAAQQMALDESKAAQKMRKKARRAGRGGPEELAAIQEQMNATKRAMALQEKQIAREEELINAIDPTIMEAATQAQKLLKGEKNTGQDIVARNREQQRTQLLNRLREQLGPGAESSTAGLQALNQFDAETENLQFGTRQQELGTLLGTALQGRPDIGRSIFGLGNISSQGFGTVGSLFHNRASRLSNIEMMAGNSAIEYAGAGNTANLVTAQGQQKSASEVKQMIPAVVGAVAGGSDIRIKENVKKADKEVTKLFDNLDAYEFEYKKEFKNSHLTGEGKRIGIMAQDLEKTKLGKEMVSVVDNGVKIVNFAKGIGAVMANQSVLNKRMKKLESSIETIGDMLSAR